MSKVIKELHIAKYTVLVLDKMPDVAYHVFGIDGKTYEPIPIYDAENCIAIESDGNFIGKTVEFLQRAT